MSNATGSLTLNVQAVELTSGEQYDTAKGTAIFMDQTVSVEAYGRAAAELNANQDSKMIVHADLLGGSSKLRIKVKRIQSVEAPTVDMSREKVTQLKQVLTLKPKATKSQVVDATSAALAILDS